MFEIPRILAAIFADTPDIKLLANTGPLPKHLKYVIVLQKKSKIKQSLTLRRSQKNRSQVVVSVPVFSESFVMFLWLLTAWVFLSFRRFRLLCFHRLFVITVEMITGIKPEF